MLKLALVTLLVPVAALRFSVGDRVEANLGQHWELGTIVSLNVQHEGMTVPYAIALDTGGSVIAPHDDDIVVRRAGTLQRSDKALRFKVGDRVEANLGHKWESGTIIDLNAQRGSSTVPYVITLDSGSSVVAPLDDDSVIRRAGSSRRVDPSLRFKVGERVEAMYDGGWAAGEVVALHYHEPRFGDGVTMPYQVRLLASGTLIFVPRDVPDMIRSPLRATQQPSRRPAPELTGVEDASQRAAGRSSAAPSKLSKRRVRGRASTIGVRHAGSKLGKSKLGKAQRARAGPSAVAPPRLSREEALARWREASSAGSF